MELESFKKTEIVFLYQQFMKLSRVWFQLHNICWAYQQSGRALVKWNARTSEFNLVDGK